MTDRSPAGAPASNEAAVAGPSFEPIGDSGVLISLGVPTDATAARAQAVAAAVDRARADAPALGRSIPAHASILVPFDPFAISLDEALDLARSAVASADHALLSRDGEIDPSATDPVEIPVRYGGANGPDLDGVADLHGLRPADVVELHAAAVYRVLFLGFAPGFAYLGGLPAALATPRRDSPRERIPAGTVAIAGVQTCVYPLAMPGGWQLIGRTDTVLFNPDRADPALLRPGDLVRFVPLVDR